MVELSPPINTHLGTYPDSPHDVHTLTNHTPGFTHTWKSHLRIHAHLQKHPCVIRGQLDWLTLGNHKQDATCLDLVTLRCRTLRKLHTSLD